MDEIINFSSLINLSETEQKNLLIEAKKGDKLAKEEFIKSYFIIIKEIIEKCTFGMNRLDENTYMNLYEDIFQEGILAIIDAYETYDINRNSRFNVYFWKCIYFKIRRYLMKNNTMFYVPQNTLNIYNNIYRYIDEMNINNEEDSSVEEIASKTGVSRKLVEEAINNVHSLIDFNDIEDSFISSENNVDDFVVLEDDLLAKKIVTEALMGNYLEIYTNEELKNIHDFGRIYQLSIKNKAGESELSELNKLKEKLLLIDNLIVDEKSIYDKYEQVYLSLRRTYIIMKRVIVSPNQQLLQSVLSEYYGVNGRMISSIEKSGLKKIKNYIKK